MAKKKSPEDLKQEGVALSEQIAKARKKQMNFALLMGKEGLVLETDHKKAPNVLWRRAKQNGGGAKGAQGRIKVSGKVIELYCEYDSAPKQLPKLFKKFLVERGQSFRVVLHTPTGTQTDDDEDSTAEDDGNRQSSETQVPGSMGAVQFDSVPQIHMAGQDNDLPEESTRQQAASTPQSQERAELMAEFDALDKTRALAAQSVHAGAAAKATHISQRYLEFVDSKPGRARAVLSLLKASVEKAIEFGTSVEGLPAQEPGASARQIDAVAQQTPAGFGHGQSGQPSAQEQALKDEAPRLGKRRRQATSAITAVKLVAAH